MAKKRKTELDIDTTAMPAIEAGEEKQEAVPLEELAQEPGEKAKGPRKPLNKKFLVIFGIIMLAVVIMSGVAAVVFSKKKTGKTVKKAVGRAEMERDSGKKVEQAKFDKLNNLVLDPFIIPRTANGGDGFIRVVFALQVNDPEVIDEVNQNLPLIRNSILYTLATRTPEELLDLATREQLLKDIRYNIDRSLQSGRVEAVLLNDLNVY